jgi:hypothetical protein
LLGGSFIVFDRFYKDFPLLHIWDSRGVFFVVRHKDNLQFTVIKENELPEKRHQHILEDQIIALKNEPSRQKHPNLLRSLAICEEVNK